MEALHHAEHAVHSILCLIQQGICDRHVRVFEDRLPARLLVLAPSPDAFSVDLPRCNGDVVGTVAEPLPEGKHAQVLALARPGEEGVTLHAECLAHGRRDRRQFFRELGEGVAQAEAETRLREQRPHAFGGAVKAIREHPADPMGGLLLERRPLDT
jgi:hypothetical protein